MLLKIFEHKSFFQILQNAVASKSERGYRMKLADAAGCQAAYLSQVLRAKANLTTEQVYRLCAFWKLDEPETEYALLVHQIDRTSCAELARFYQKKAYQLREEHGTLAKRIGADATVTLTEQDRCRYYSSWQYAAIHMLTSIPHFQSTTSISHRLGLPLDRVETVVNDLCKMHLIERSGKSLKIRQLQIHIDENHPLNLTNHINWRNHCAAQIQNEDSGALHYTAVHTLSSADASKIRDILLAAIRASREVVAPSPEEDALVVLVDCYRLQN
jgi:hypothetical protein